LVPVAWASDGVIEAAEVDGAAWQIGVQWHPEVTAAKDRAQQGLFDALVEAAR
jgi:putative glutamine amidotransferase